MSYNAHSGNASSNQSYTFPSSQPRAMPAHKRSREDDDDEDEDAFDPDFEAPAYDDQAGDSDFNEPGPSSSQAPPQLPTPPKEEGGRQMPRPRARTVSSQSQPERERKSIQIEYIQDKSRRHITFSKRKAGIMKKAYELSTLTGTQVLLLVVSETGMVYTFTTVKLQPIVNEDHGQRLIEACLAAEEGQLPAFAARDYQEDANYEPALNIRRSNGQKSPRKRTVSSGRPTTPGGTEERRTSTRHVSKSHEAAAPRIASPSQRPQPPLPQHQQPPPPTHHQMLPMPPGPQHHLIHPMHAIPSQIPMHMQHTSNDHLNTYYEQMVTSQAQTAGVQSMTIPPYFTDGSYRQEYRQDTQWQQ